VTASGNWRGSPSAIWLHRPSRRRSFCGTPRAILVPTQCGCSLHPLHIRDVPDDVHDALAEAAEAQGLSLTRYMLHELEHLAKRPQVVQDNAAVIRRTQAKVQGRPDRDTILSVLHEGRGN
jgi:hypothetical protein